MKSIKTDFLIVGAGLYGCVLAERIATKLKKTVLILERRNHLGGNCYSEIDEETNIEYNKYGPHIFHTSLDNVWEYINSFTKFNNYRHQGLANYRDKIYQLPINLETINSFFNKNFTPSQAKAFIKKKSKKFFKISVNNFEDKALMQIGKELYEAFFKSYTSKQWDKDPKKLPSSIFNRLPLRFNYNEDYFHSSRFQGIPLNGYTALFDNLINNKLINYELGKSFNIDDDIKVKYLVIYTGPIDKLLNYKIGRLDWRSLKFKKEIKNVEDFQGTSLINYPEKKFKFTRIYEPKHLHPERKYELNKTLIIKEFPNFNNDEPYYPINDNLNRKLHRKYKMLVTKIKKYNIITGGRLGDYSYYDMDMTISAALKKFNNIEKSLK